MFKPPQKLSVILSYAISQLSCAIEDSIRKLSMVFTTVSLICSPLQNSVSFLSSFKCPYKFGVSPYFLTISFQQIIQESASISYIALLQDPLTFSLPIVGMSLIIIAIELDESDFASRLILNTIAMQNRARRIQELALPMNYLSLSIRHNYIPLALINHPIMQFKHATNIFWFTASIYIPQPCSLNSFALIEIVGERAQLMLNLIYFIGNGWKLCL